LSISAKRVTLLKNINKAPLHVKAVRIVEEKKRSSTSHKALNKASIGTYFKKVGGLKKLPLVYLNIPCNQAE
jgi:hypothetical protein